MPIHNHPDSSRVAATPHAGATGGGESPLIKLYGERNCGTHYLTRLVTANLECRLLESVEPRFVRRAARNLRAPELVRDVYYGLTFRRNLGWKHMNPKAPDELRRQGIDLDALRFILLTKNPYSWALSMLRNPYHLGVNGPADIDRFVTRRWRCSRRENMAGSRARLMEMWSTKIRSYLTLASHARASIVRYEDLLLDPASSIASIASALSLRRRSDGFVNVDASAKKGGRAQGRTFESYRQYYVQEKWRGELTPTAIAAMNEALDPELMKRLGYAILAPDAPAATVT